MRTPTTWFAALALAAALALTGCGGDSDDAPAAGGDGEATDEATDDGLDSPEACELLTDEEVTAAIGEHQPGEQDYALGGCVWSSTAEPSEDTGFVPAVHATVLEQGHYEQLAEIGEPIDGFGDGATYDEISGELWFPCAGDQWCGIKAGVADSDERLPVARTLAEALGDRVG